MSNLTRYKMRIEDSPSGECQAVLPVASKEGRWVKFDDIKELLNSSHNKQSTPLCSACGVELSCRNHCYDTNSPHGIVAI